VRHPNSTPHARRPSKTVVGVHGVPPSDDLESGWGLAPRDQTDVVSKYPLQLLLGELLQRPIEFTQYRRHGNRISTDGGVQAQWSGDGRELFYLALEGRLVAVPVVLSSNGATLSATAVPLFAARVGSLQDIPLNLYLVSSDGQRFLLDTIVEEAASPIGVVLNWKPPAD
jgi:hypothetical protein